MRNKWIADLLNFFEQIIKSEKMLNTLKKQLSQLSGFNPLILFQKIAGQQQNITIKNMQVFLDGKIACNQRQLYEIFQRFDHHRFGFISFQDFCQQIASSSTSRKKMNSIKLQGNLDCIVQFKNIVSVMIRVVRVLDTWRKQLESVTPYIIFQDINRSKTGVISKKQLIYFYYQNQRYLDTKDCDILYSTLLRRCYSQINLQVFCQNLKPLQFDYYKAYKYYYDKNIEHELLQKAHLAKKAIDVQQNYLKEKRNQEIVEIVHEQAALNRQRQLQLRVQDQIKAYNQLKFLTRKKFHPELTIDDFMLVEKENEMKNQVQAQIHEENRKIYRMKYQDKMMNIQALKQVQNFEARKGMLVDNFATPSNKRNTETKMTREQLEKRIRTSAYSARNADDLLMKRQLTRNFNNYMKMI